jgi:hypothetical protein
MVTPPLPHRSRHPPIMNAERHVIGVGAGAPPNRAMVYIMTPEIKNRDPAIINGGMDWMANNIPRYVEPQIR